MFCLSDGQVLDASGVDVVQALLTAGAAKDQACAAGATPLQVASVLGSVDVVQALLTAGAGPPRWSAGGFAVEPRTRAQACVGPVEHDFQQRRA